MMFRSYSNTYEYFLRDYVAIAIVIFKNNMLFSRVKISCLRAKAHLVFHWCLYNNTLYSLTKTGKYLSSDIPNFQNR